MNRFEEGEKITLHNDEAEEFDFTIKKELGGGCYGKVFKVVNKNGEFYALKVAHGENQQGFLDNEIDNAKNEAKVILENKNLLEDKNIVTPKQIFIVANTPRTKFVCFLMELIEGKTIEDKLGEKRSMQRNMNIIIKLLKLVKKIHENGVTHGDLKPSNV